MFGLVFDNCRKKMGIAYRKTLAGDYKTDKALRKNPHALGMEQRYQLLTKKKGGDWKQMHRRIQDSNKPFGKFYRSKFVMDANRVPLLDIPNIGGFDLLPYVSSHTPKIKQQTKALITERSMLPDRAKVEEN